MNLRLAVVQSLLLLLSMLTPLSLASANQDIFAAATTEQNVQVELFQFDSPHKQKVAIELAKSLRCPQCQNQNLVESNSPIAKDLRLIVFSKINQGQSEQQVIDFMTARYGEFVLYKPTFTASNALLWLAPILLLLLFLIVSFVRIDQRKQR
ncbi:heme lyase NrfEFG subunit NrfF [Vibrio tubiashii]|uniref:heme lyase NrfEFG subunit NrfF n=1 Tax=Vibrio tubiashii TaxID=29498 RepID=UPI001EFEB364|nr:heme lyase NrfEFG subunit NrfF [Vibrio tubiashii]MCG9583199.1 heme lyase NrfEFG subunit NrfF [Vibrio tubiashii]MCG9616793.1 heme lyase NrfEFG subunit NrfF [Vibrio tubiashii]MCG9689314.1 heme lyase NrfEFG subunit NrfF [Vibrio tubiashii]